MPTDITYLPIADGSLTGRTCIWRRYWIVVLAGLWALLFNDHMRSLLVIEAVNNACATRRSLAGSVFHLRPRQCVYLKMSSRKPAVTLVSPNRWGLWEPVPITRLLQSFNSTLKREVRQDRKTFANQLECRRQVFRWCARYNTSRRHSWCGY